MHIPWKTRAYQEVLQRAKADQKEKKEKPKAATTTTRKDSDSGSSGLIASHALSVSSLSEQGTLVVGSGATCHMCHDSKWTSYKIQLMWYWEMDVHLQQLEREKWN